MNSPHCTPGRHDVRLTYREILNTSFAPELILGENLCKMVPLNCTVPILCFTITKQDVYQLIAPMWLNTKAEYISLSPADIHCHQQLHHKHNPFISMQPLLCLLITPTTYCHLTRIPACSPSQTGLTVYSNHAMVIRVAPPVAPEMTEHSARMENLTSIYPQHPPWDMPWSPHQTFRLRCTMSKASLCISIQTQPSQTGGSKLQRWLKLKIS